jgi:hypothetical protein
MGRALYSLAYAVPQPAVRTEPEPDVDRVGRWSAWNRFDPDSDDFFQDAEYEAFIDDPVSVERSRAQMSPVPTVAEAASDGLDSGDSSDSEQSTPMLVRPVVVDVRLLNDGGFSRSARSVALGRSASLSPVHSPVSPQNSDQLGNPPFIPPPSFRQPSPDIIMEPESPAAPRRGSPFRRTVNIVPISASRIQIQPATRSPSPDSPATPPSLTTPLRQSRQMLTPSPPPSITPRFYSWQTHAIPSLPTSPTIIRSSNRRPLARLQTSPARVRVPNTVM